MPATTLSALETIVARQPETPTAKHVLICLEEAEELLAAGAATERPPEILPPGQVEILFTFRGKTFNYVGMKEPFSDLMGEEHDQKVRDQIGPWFDRLPEDEQERHRSDLKTRQLRPVFDRIHAGTGIPFRELEHARRYRWEVMRAMDLCWDLPD